MNSENKYFLNANSVFLLFALLGLILSLLIKFTFNASEQSFYPTLGTCAVLLIAFHRFCYVVITQDKFRELGIGKKLTEAAVVDSCYYLGFIYTLIILITTFINIGQEAENIQIYNSNLNGLMDILNRFCVGLFTTGYGLVARIHLSNLIELEELDTDGLHNKLNTKTQALIQIIDLGINSIESLVSKTNQSISDSISLANDSIKQNSAELAKDAGSISSKLKLITKKIEEQVPNFDLSLPTNAVVSHLSTTALSVDSLNKSIKKIQLNFENADKTASGSVEKFAGSIDSVASQYTKMSSQMESFSNGLIKFTQNLTDSNQSANALTNSVQLLSDHSRDTSSNMQSLNESMEIVRNKFGELSNQIGEGEKQISRIRDIVNITEGRASQEVTRFIESMNGLINSLEYRNIQLCNQLEMLEGSFQKLEAAATTVSLEIKSERSSFWKR